MNPIHSLVLVMCGISLSILVQCFFRYARYRKSRIPSLAYCLGMIVSTAMYLLSHILAFILPEGPQLNVMALLHIFISVTTNTLFLLIVVSLITPAQGWLNRHAWLFLLVPLLLVPLLATNGLHHWFFVAVTKQDGIMFHTTSGPMGNWIYYYSFSLSVLAFGLIFNVKTKLKRDRLARLVLFVAAVVPAGFSLLESTVPLLQNLQVGLVFMWVPIVMVCYLFFGYLSTASDNAVGNMEDAYMVFDFRGNCVVRNAKAETWFSRYADSTTPDAAVLSRILKVDDLLSVQDTVDVELEEDGSLAYYQVRRFQLGHGISQYTGHGFIIHDNTSFVLEMNKLDRMASRDALTGARNRRDLESSGVALFKKAIADKRPVTVCMVDIDWFKSVNDQYGHPVGDIVLRGVASILEQNLREGDMVFRYGGEEFLVMCAGMPAKAAKRFAEQIRAAVATETFMAGEKSFGVTVSLGIHSQVPLAGQSIEGFVEVADECLYAAKQNGRNRVEQSAPAGAPLA